jgi:hypothetical protein
MQAPSTPTPPTPPTPPNPPNVPAPDVVGQAVIAGPGAPSPADVYQGLRAQRRELERQLESLEDKRGDLAGQLEEATTTGGNAKGIEQRISEIDQRISSIDAQIAAADAAVARAAAVPGATIEPPPPPPTGPPPEAFALGGLFMVIALLPLSIALARRIWRRGAAGVAAVPAEIREHLARLEQAVDAIAIEVERIGEGQRFITRFFSEDGRVRAIGAGPAEPVQVKAQQEETPHLRR